MHATAPPMAATRSRPTSSSGGCVSAVRTCAWPQGRRERRDRGTTSLPRDGNRKVRLLNTITLNTITRPGSETLTIAPPASARSCTPTSEPSSQNTEDLALAHKRGAGTCRSGADRSGSACRVVRQVGSTTSRGMVASWSAEHRPCDNRRVGGVVAYRLRANLRRWWRVGLGLALLVAVLGGVVLATAAGARRTSSAYGRLLDVVNPPELLVSPPGGGPGFDPSPFYDALAQVPGVRGSESSPASHWRRRRGHHRPVSPRHSAGAVCCAAIGDGGADIGRPRMVSGRLPDPGRADEVMVSERFASGRRRRCRRSHRRRDPDGRRDGQRRSGGDRRSGHSHSAHRDRNRRAARRGRALRRSQRLRHSARHGRAVGDGRAWGVELRRGDGRRRTGHRSRRADGRHRGPRPTSGSGYRRAGLRLGPSGRSTTDERRDASAGVRARRRRCGHWLRGPPRRGPGHLEGQPGDQRRCRSAPRHRLPTRRPRRVPRQPRGGHRRGRGGRRRGDRRGAFRPVPVRRGAGGRARTRPAHRPDRPRRWSWGDRRTDHPQRATVRAPRRAIAGPSDPGPLASPARLRRAACRRPRCRAFASRRTAAAPVRCRCAAHSSP